MIEKVSGEPWTRKQIGSQAAIEEYKKKFADGASFAVYKLIELGFVTGRFGGWLEQNEKIWNDQLDLPKQNFEEVVKDALGKIKEVFEAHTPAPSIHSLLEHCINIESNRDSIFHIIAIFQSECISINASKVFRNLQYGLSGHSSSRHSVADA